ncbi:histidine kinase/DNA gyrase B/HSP90-like ATPase [Kordia periserrulae]|uniref:histidine kinase n=1 Tax=Kordia periserrulae TaxID=701523 RepID=A0A2T6C4E8_9FLAO|nr:HAMP domain-containing sensor histidine kinase [Kordia periserrulae]PTX63153.1 histidine kinase/DNA gyrase B/HSP90-like ATPase [Kordia periserrulae]
MGYKKLRLRLYAQIGALLLCTVCLTYFFLDASLEKNISFVLFYVVPFVIIIFFIIRNIITSSVKRLRETYTFLDAIKHRDFSRWFPENQGSRGIRELHTKFNDANTTIHALDTERETQHLYLQKVLSLLDSGIIAYETESGKVLWMNDAFKRILQLPTLKNIDFIKKRKKEIYDTFLEKDYPSKSVVPLTQHEEEGAILITSTIFKMDNSTFKLVVLQNISETLTKNENESWNKLLRVLTHEIMNSIAPIASLTETLQNKIALSTDAPQEYPLDMEDVTLILESIQKRSEGLMQFAKTYRGLNKINSINLKKIQVADLFSSINNILLPSLNKKNIELHFFEKNANVYINADAHLLEQVLINIILNSVEAEASDRPLVINVHAEKTIEGTTVIRIQDNGKGIAPEVIDNVFIPFFSTKKSGSGIGLSLCKQIMLLHGGKIQLKSVENKGTTTSLIFINSF